MNAPIVVTTGFVASTVEGTPTTLKRSGSDYSATIFAKLMAASKARERHRRFLAHTTEPPAKSSARFALAQITMWKNVDGVYTADPRRVPEAFPIESLKYDEAIELAFFGAQARAAHCPDSSSFPQFAAPRAAKHPPPRAIHASPLCNGGGRSSIPLRWRRASKSASPFSSATFSTPRIPGR